MAAMSTLELEPEAPPKVTPAAPGGRFGAVRRIASPRRVLMLAIGVAVGYLALVPMAYLLVGTFVGPQGLTLEFLRSAFAQDDIVETLWNTLFFSVGAALFATIVGATLAFLVARTDIPLKSFVTAAALVPLIIPGILHTVAWLLLASPNIGVFNVVLKGVGLGRVDISSMGGMIFVQGLHTVPLVFLLMLPAFQAMDPSLEEAASIAGSGLGELLRRITLPMLRPALYAALLITLVTSMEGFEVPLLLGNPGGIGVLATKVWFVLQQYPVDYGAAGSYSMILVVLTIGGSYLYSRFSKSSRRYQTVTGKGFRPRQIALGKWRWVGAAFVAGYFFLAVIAPTLVLVWASAQRSYRQPALDSLSRLSLHNYERVLQDPSGLRALRNSLLLSGGAATLVMLLMAVAAWLVIRTRIRGRWMLDGLSFVPIALPSVVLGVALIFVYLRSPVPIYGTLWILLIAYTTRYMPYGMRYSSSAMHQIGQELEEASEVSGAGLWKTLRRIDLPLLMPGLISGWIFIMVSAMRELSTSLLLYSPGNEVVPVLIWSQYSDGEFGALAALGVIMIVVLVLLVLLMLIVGRRFRGGVRIESV